MKLVLSIVLGLLAAFFAAVLVAALSTGPEGVTALSLGTKEASLAVASGELPAGHVLDDKDITIKTIKASASPSGAIGSTASLVGRTLIRPVVSGQAITRSAIAGTGTGPEIESMLEQGYRATTITLADRGPGAFVFPGSSVDVISTFEVPRGYEGAGMTMTRTVLEGVRVLAVDGFQDAQKQAAALAKGTRNRSTSKGPMITLLVTPAQAQVIQLARTMGTLSVTLRPQGELDRGLGGMLTLERMMDLRLVKPTVASTPSMPRTSAVPKEVLIVKNADSPAESTTESEEDTEEESLEAPAPQRRWTTTVIRGNKRSVYTFEESE